MSGIYIPGLRVPGENDDELWIAVRSDGTVTYNADWGWTENKKKAIPVPDHGRLIDADALLESEQGYTIPNYNSDGYLADSEGAYTEVQIENAPTIIPASEGESKT